MCRVMLIYGSNYDLILKTLNAFVEASEYDKYKVLLGSTPSHKDGWGYAAFSITSDNKINKMLYYKSIDPVFMDNEGMYKLIDFIRESDKILVLMHSRAISVGALNIFNTHPYYYLGKNYNLCFAHNGTMYKDELTRILGIKKDYAKDLSDSYLLGLLLYTKINYLNKEEIIKVYKEVSKYTKTAMNTIGIYYRPSETILAITSSYLNKSLENDQKRKDYYKLYELIGDDTYLIASSSVAENVLNLYNRFDIFLNKLLYVSIDYNLEKVTVEKYEL